MRIRSFRARLLFVLTAVVAIGGVGVFPAVGAPRMVLGEYFTATW